MDLPWEVDWNWLWPAIFRVASPHARMGLPEVSLGVIPGYGRNPSRFPQIIGRGKGHGNDFLTGGMDRLLLRHLRNYGLVNYVGWNKRH